MAHSIARANPPDYLTNDQDFRVILNYAMNF